MSKSSIGFRMALACAVSLAGCSGSTGPTGAQGAQGEPGAQGAQGSQGAQGTQGTQGTQGAQGPQGPQGPAGSSATDAAAAFTTATPIKHVVVIFQENVSFDHYFATYPVAQNNPGETPFTGVDAGPANNLVSPLDPTNKFAPLTGINLLTSNPNATGSGGTKNGLNAQNPFRLSPAEGATADQNHDYTAEQQAFDDGLMDLFPFYTGTGDTAPPENTSPPLNTAALVMGYYDGNTVTAIWNYAQHFAMNDNSFDTMFGPSAPGAINLVSGQTNGVLNTNVKASGSGTNLDGDITNDGNGGVTLTSDAQPLGDICSSRDAVELSGANVGDLLNDAGVSWGFFQGGFDLTQTNTNGTTGCNRKSTSAVTQQLKVDYIPHHQPFQYYASTRNQTHARPSSVMAIGQSFEADGKTPDPANHQYDIHDFVDALQVGNFPAVSYLKAPGYQDGHAGYSSPQDEQTFLADVINTIQNTPEWSSTAILIQYDDSDGWYDHQMPPIVNPSTVTAANANVTLSGLTVAGNPDALNGAGLCNTSIAQQGGATPANPLDGVGGKTAQGRCGYGPRLPFIVISPYAKVNYIDHTLTDQTSSLRFIEDNWLGKQRIEGSFDALAGDITSAGSMLDFAAGPTNGPLFLSPAAGLPVDCPTCL